MNTNYNNPFINFQIPQNKENLSNHHGALIERNNNNNNFYYSDSPKINKRETKLYALSPLNRLPETSYDLTNQNNITFYDISKISKKVIKKRKNLKEIPATFLSKFICSNHNNIYNSNNVNNINNNIINNNDNINNSNNNDQMASPPSPTSVPTSLTVSVLSENNINNNNENINKHTPLPSITSFQAVLLPSIQEKPDPESENLQNASLPSFNSFIRLWDSPAFLESPLSAISSLISTSFQSNQSN